MITIYLKPEALFDPLFIVGQGQNIDQLSELVGAQLVDIARLGGQG